MYTKMVDGFLVDNQAHSRDDRHNGTAQGRACWTKEYNCEMILKKKLVIIVKLNLFHGNLITEY